MRLWKKTDETELERELRAQRPQPPDEFVRSLGRLIEPVRRPRRALAPKLALVAAVTALLSVSLGAAGALGYAGTSMSAFGHGFGQLIHVTPPSVHTPTTANPNGGTVESDHHEWKDPFHHQYGIKIPICWNGQIIWVSPGELFWYILHGARPWRECGIPVPHHHHP